MVTQLVTYDSLLGDSLSLYGIIWHRDRRITNSNILYIVLSDYDLNGIMLLYSNLFYFLKVLNSLYIEYDTHMVLLNFVYVYINHGYSTNGCYLFSGFAASWPKWLLWLKDIEPMMHRLPTHICGLNELIKSLSPFNLRSRAGAGYQTIKLSGVLFLSWHTRNGVSISNGDSEKYSLITLATYV